MQNLDITKAPKMGAFVFIGSTNIKVVQILKL